VDRITASSLLAVIGADMGPIPYSPSGGLLAGICLAIMSAPQTVQREGQQGKPLPTPGSLPTGLAVSHTKNGIALTLYPDWRHGAESSAAIAAVAHNISRGGVLHSQKLGRLPRSRWELFRQGEPGRTTSSPGAAAGTPGARCSAVCS
jgi:hypothetical protein